MSDAKKDLKDTKKMLDDISPSMCLAKWFQVTLHLQNGHNHSCYHPESHEIPLEELEKNPSALHNTNFKKEQRKLMLEGSRPSECDYCWRVEDLNTDQYSDRIMKSNEFWARPYAKEALSKEWNYDFNPRYLEVNFGYECNLTCSYCSPAISSSIWAEFEKHGSYPTSVVRDDLNFLNKDGLRPFKKGEHNPYVEAFWKWFPTIADDLLVFRITGGEPLINNNTFKVFDYIYDNPLPNLELAINTNLMMPDNRFDMFIEKLNKLLDEKKIKAFKLYTSVDTYGDQAEFIRFGLKFEKIWSNIEKYLNQVKDSKSALVFMVTYNIMSIPRFKLLLEKYLLLTKKFKNPALGQRKIYFDIPHLTHPEYLCSNIITDDLKPYLDDCLDFIKKHTDDNAQEGGFNSFERNNFERIVQWLNSTEVDQQINIHRADFFRFINEYEKRKGLNFLETFPELEKFYKLCKKLAFMMGV